MPFDVKFADPKKYFYPGETIIGDIIVRVDSATTCKKITLKLKGKCSISWTSGTGDDKTTYENGEEYFKNIITLSEPEYGNAEIFLPPGEYFYPFQFQLPNDLPPSIEPPYVTGGVCYYVRVKMYVDSYRRKSDVQEKMPFKVVASPVDLNQARHLLEPATCTEEKILCCLCCQSGPIILSGKIERQAFYLGDQILFSFELDNRQTDKPLRKVEARLIAKYTMISNNGMEVSEKVARSSLRLTESVEPQSEGSWNDVAMNIPKDIIPSFNNCNCVHLEYCFIVNVDIESAFDPKLSFPITISNGPLSVQPNSIPRNVELFAPGMAYPPPLAGGSILPPPSSQPVEGYPLPTADPQHALYPPITHQPTTYNPDVPISSHELEQKT